MLLHYRNLQISPGPRWKTTRGAVVSRWNARVRPKGRRGRLLGVEREEDGEAWGEEEQEPRRRWRIGGLGRGCGFSAWCRWFAALVPSNPRSPARPAIFLLPRSPPSVFDTARRPAPIRCIPSSRAGRGSLNLAVNTAIARDVPSALI